MTIPCNIAIPELAITRMRLTYTVYILRILKYDITRGCSSVVERPLRMRKATGSIPVTSNRSFLAKLCVNMVKRVTRSVRYFANEPTEMGSGI